MSVDARADERDCKSKWTQTIKPHTMLKSMFSFHYNYNINIVVLCKHTDFFSLICLGEKITHQQMENKLKTIWDELRWDTSFTASIA